MKKHKEILSRFGINKTQFRIDLLSLFFDCKSSLTIHKIFERFNKKTNKVTIYRALKSFEQKGLIHQVPDKNNLKKYSLCNLDSCSPDSHNHQHGHFICYSCDQTFCLDDSIIKILKTSSGHIVKNYNLILEGYCTDCNSSQTISQN